MENYLIIFIIAVVAVAILITVFVIKKNQDPRIVWKKIYKKWFNLEKDFSNLQIPKNYDPKKHFAIIVAKGLTIKEVIIAIRNFFSVYLYVEYFHIENIEDLDKNICQNDRTTEVGDYVVLFNKNVEADKEFVNLSANRLKVINHKGITLMERLLLEILYSDKTKKHLDIENKTLCAGSRDYMGNVPYVNWFLGYKKLNIEHCGPAYSNYNFRSRVVVYP